MRKLPSDLEHGNHLGTFGLKTTTSWQNLGHPSFSLSAVRNALITKCWTLTVPHGCRELKFKDNSKAKTQIRYQIVSI
jgi:hypothetical protein